MHTHTHTHTHTDLPILEGVKPINTMLIDRNWGPEGTVLKSTRFKDLADC